MAGYLQFAFSVRDDEKMQETVASIKLNGVMVPGLARPEKDGNGYEIAVGHRRCRASELAGLEEMPFIVQEMTDHEAVEAMKDSSKQRDAMLPARAFSRGYHSTLYPLFARFIFLLFRVHNALNHARYNGV